MIGIAPSFTRRASSSAMPVFALPWRIAAYIGLPPVSCPVLHGPFAFADPRTACEGIAKPNWEAGMRGVVFTGDKTLELSEVPDPTPGPMDVVLEMKASGLCGSDLKFYRAPKGMDP